MTAEEAAYIMMCGASSPMNVQKLEVAANGTYIAANWNCDAFDPVIVDVPSENKYTFPADSTIDEIMSAVKDDPVTDETKGVALVPMREEIETEIYVHLDLVDDEGKVIKGITGSHFGKPAIPDAGIVSSQINPETGHFDVTYFMVTWDVPSASYKKFIYHWIGTDPDLIGFGAEGHTISVRNK